MKIALAVLCLVAALMGLCAGGCGSSGGGASDSNATADASSDGAVGNDTISPDVAAETAADRVTPDAAPADAATGDEPSGDSAQPDAALSDAEPDVPATPVPLSYATYNAGLAVNFVPLAPERVEPVIDALSKLTAEVVCLQEVWEPDHVAAMKEGLKDVYPEFLYVDTSEAGGGGAPPCTAEELAPLQECVVANCTGSDDITGCVMANCLEPFSALASGCTQCLAANLSKPLEEIFATCTASGAVMSYDGRNGLILLAHREFDTTEHLVLDSFLLRRVVLHATFKNDPDNTHVFCTHLSAPLSEMEYAGKYESWEAEQAAQIDQMVAWIDTQAGTDPTVLLGDMNCGPAADGVSAALPENYEKLVSAGGFIDVYMVALAPECTWCASNTLVDDGNDNQIIDHVLVRSFAMDEVPVAERFLDQLVEVTVDGQPQQTNLSDHFGVWWH